jgi:hypothetical protein
MLGGMRGLLIWQLSTIGTHIFRNAEVEEVSENRGREEEGVEEEIRIPNRYLRRAPSLYGEMSKLSKDNWLYLVRQEPQHVFSEVN